MRWGHYGTEEAELEDGAFELPVERSLTTFQPSPTVMASGYLPEQRGRMCYLLKLVPSSQLDSAT